ncbi:MAG: type II secretion system protein, partial [Pedosphaera parvula]|nr:type II secretion system protein [Pedosphaera parvula]
NISYFLGLDADETRPQMILAGDRNLSLNGKPVKSGLLSVTTNDVLGVTAELHAFAPNVVLSDGSVQQFNSGRFRAQLLPSGAATNRFLVP